MKNKNIFICALLVVMVLFCIGTASAEDSLNANLGADEASGGQLGANVATNAVASESAPDALGASGDTIYVNSSYNGDDEQGTQSNPYKAISTAVGKATGGETIFISNGNYSESAKISPTVSLSFVGESHGGVKITSSSSSLGVFEMYNSGIVLSFVNLTFKDVNAGTASNLVMKIGGDQDLSIINCSFIDCSSKFGVLQVYTSGTATIENCEILNFKCTKTAGTGGLYLSGNGVYNFRNLVIDNSSFNGLSGQMNGIVYLYSSGSPRATANFEGLRITNCRGAANSVIRSSGNLNIKGSQIINNTITKSATDSAGEGLIYDQYAMNISQSIIAGNVGPQIVLYKTTAADLTLNYCNIVNNTFANGIFDSTAGDYDVNNNYWGSNDLPEGVTATSWIVENNGAYTFNDGSALDVIVPGLDGNSAAGDGTIYVSTTGNDTNDGTTEATAVATVAKAIELASEGKIVVLAGTYKTGNLGSIDKNLTITGQGNVIFDADNNARILYVGTGSNVVLNNIVMINGYTATSESGALIGNAGNLTLNDCTLANSTSSKNGGAIYNAAYLTINNCIFENNKASQNGGAIFSQSSGIGITPTLNVDNSVFTENSAGGNSNFGGGAIFVQQNADTLAITNSNFTKNTVANYGGGAVEIVNTNAAKITGCRFVENTAKGDSDSQNYGGGAISFIGAYSDKKETLTLSNDLFEDNYAEVGGAIYVRAATVNVANSILVGNDDDEGLTIFSRVTSMVTPTVTANDNWWGSDESPKGRVSNSATLNRWVILTVSNDTEIAEGNNVTINVNLNTYTTGSTSGTLATPIDVAHKVTITTSNDEITGVLSNGEFNYVYAVPAGLKYIRATVDSQSELLYFVPTATSVSLSGFTAKKGERHQFNIKVNADDNSIVNQGKVILFIGEETIGQLDVVNGTASGKVMISQGSGSYQLTAKYVDDEGLYQESHTTVTLKVSGNNNQITSSNFYDFFDVDGYIYHDIPFTSLTVKGTFTNIGVDKITIDTPITLTGSSAVLNNIVVDVLSPDVTLKSITFNCVNISGAVVNVATDDVTLTSLTINYQTVKDTSAFGIYAYGVDNLNVGSSKITFTSNSIGTKGYYQYAIELRDVTNSKITGTTINAYLPACDCNWDEGITGIDHDLILAVGIQNGENITFTSNKVYTDITGIYGYYPTVDSLMADSVDNLEISSNTFVQTDKSEGNPGYSNVVDLYSTNNAKVIGNDILVNSSAGVDGSGTAYPIQLTGPYTGLVIDSNTLTAISKGPTLGIYSQNYNGATDLTVTNNVIDVTGYASNSSAWSLVSGMELQDDMAKIYNNTIYSRNINGFDETNYLYGISFAQWLYGDHSFDIKDNTIKTKGKYAVYFLNAVNTNITGNDLRAYELWGDNAAIIKEGEGNVIENNIPPYDADIQINAPNAWIDRNTVITVVVPEATGNVTIIVNGKEFKELQLVNNSVSQEVSVEDLVFGVINNVTVIYNGDIIVMPGRNNATFKIVDGIITNETFEDYFTGGVLDSFVPEGATLDFQGVFNGNMAAKITVPVNIISSTGDAVFNATGATGNKANFTISADYVNMTGITFKNTCVYVIGASHVTIDAINVIANVGGVGRSTGFVAIHTGSYYTTVKNCYMENGGTGSSCLVLGNGGKYASFDNNTFMITGGSGNILSSNIYVGTGDRPEYVNYTNNLVNNTQAASGFAYGITCCGQGNIVENNTLYHKGSGIVNQYGTSDSSGNIYRNNVLVGSTLSAGTNAIVEDNYVTGDVTIAAGSIVRNNTFEGKFTVSGAGATLTDNTIGGATTISGANVVAKANTFNGAVTISGKNTEFTNNNVTKKVTVSSSGNTITYNTVNVTSGNTIALTGTGNTVMYNRLFSGDMVGDDTVSAAAGNNVSRNMGSKIMTIEVNDVWTGFNNNITITVVNGTGNVTVKVNEKEFVEVPLVDGAVTIEVNASDLALGFNDVVVTYNGDDFIAAGTDYANFTAIGNVVTQDSFYTYFDEYGFVKSDVPFDELIFEGEFKGLTDYIIISRAINITGQGAILNNIGIVISKAGVKVDNFTLIANKSLGSLISVVENDAIISNMNISYVVDDESAIAIDVQGVENVKIINNNIYLETHVTDDEKDANAINVNQASKVIIDNNNVTTSFPALFASNYDWEYFMMGLNTVNPIRLRASSDIKFTNNNVDSRLNDASASFPTIQCLFVVGCKDVLFDGNDFKMIDDVSKVGTSSYLYAINFGYDENITISNNNFFISTLSGQDAAGSAYAIQGVESEIKIINNNITSFSNGPNLGIYSSSMMGGSSDLYIEGNTFNITGYATSSSAWALISGIEITNGDAAIYNNTIYTYNNAGYVEKAPVYGVSYAQYMYGDRSLDVQDNTMYVEGKYAVSVLSGTELSVISNKLYAHELYGDGAVDPQAAATVEDNYPYSPKVIAEIENIVVKQDAIIKVSYNPNATGVVTVIVDGKSYTLDNVINGTGSITVSGLVANNYTVGVTFKSNTPDFGDDEYTTVFTVSKMESDVIISVDDNLKVGDDATINVEISGATGNVSFIVDGAEIVKTLAKGKASYTIDAVTAGNHTITVIYNGDDNHKAAYNTTSFLVSKLDSGIEATSEPIEVGSDAVINITVDAKATGSVLVDGKYYAVIDNGTATVSIPNLANGTYELAVAYSGDDNFNAADINVTVKVNKIVATPQISVDSIELGEDAYVYVELPEGATGNVTLFINDVEIETKELSRGVAEFDVSDLTNGSKVAKVVYSGDDKFTGGEASAEFDVDYDVSIESDAVYGYDAIVEITLPDGATGNVTVTIGNETYEAEVDEGYALVEIPGLDAGTYTMVITYSGDDKYPSITVEDTLDVLADIEIPDDFDFNETSDISISLPEDATGNLTVSVDGVETTVPVVNGTASVPLDNLTPGEHNITVSYSGDGKYDPISAEKTIEVAPAIDIPEEITTDDDDTISIDLPKDATGNLTVVVDGVETTVPVVNGTASVDLGTLTAGEHNVSVSYSGDDKYPAYSKSVTATVAKATAPVVVSVPTNAQEGKVVPVTIALPSDATGTVFININGSGYYAELVNGTATIKVSGLTGGEKEVSYRYTGDSKYAETTGNASINILYKPKLTNNKALVMSYFDGSAYKVRVWGTNGKLVGAGKVVTFKINGKTYRVKTNKYSYALLKIRELPKKYIITATYGGAKVSNVVLVKQILVSKNVIAKKSAKQVVLTAALKKVKGKYLKGKVIKFTIQGRNYYAKTNAYGVAKLVLKAPVLKNLKLGKSVLKVTYLKDTIKKILVVRK